VADKLDVEVTGKSKFQVAEEMARYILFSIEKKSGNVTRKEYLKAVEQSIYVLGGGPAPD